MQLLGRERDDHFHYREKRMSTAGSTKGKDALKGFFHRGTFSTTHGSFARRIHTAQASMQQA